MITSRVNGKTVVVVSDSDIVEYLASKMATGSRTNWEG